ncbi:YkgJ family cysteine cluster protein [Halobacterium zhouii]|uniref:YkgJ family cysteine cluster protein n=1 Tax=Halobacterium zhouii TaxID=2902624 RepID=UPI001E600175|nr:YkgJ family cysteine cluster protein [Halobacterium zhouii]
MEVDCSNCAGCCVDWRALADVSDHERDGRGPQQPLDDAYNLVPLTREDVRTFLDSGLGDAMTPRLWEADYGPSVTVGDHEVAAINGKPAFFVGLRKPPKPVAAFGGASGGGSTAGGDSTVDAESTASGDADVGFDPAWLPTCAFLDPETLQCRIHGDPEYPEECATYPGHNLALDAETECERVERHVGGERLLDDTPPEDDPGLLFGPQAVGETVFAYPEPADLEGALLDRLAVGELADEDRARFVAVAAASAPGTTAVEPTKRKEAYQTALEADSWVGQSIREWEERADSDDPDSGLSERVEVERGAPETPGWEQ